MLTMMQTLIVNVVYLLFPITIYLIYIAYIRNMDLEEKKIFFNIAVFSSIYFIIRFGINYDPIVSLILLNVPLLLAYLKKNNFLVIIISLICIIYCHKVLKVQIFLFVIEYLIYFILYHYLFTKKKFIKNPIHLFVILKAFAISIQLNVFIRADVDPIRNIFYVLGVICIFIFISYLILYFLWKGEEIMDLNATLNALEKEKRVRASLFKITHEIKNPIAVCKGYLDMMDYNEPETVERYTKIIKDEIGRTLILMDDFLSCTKVKIEKEEVDLCLLLEEICDSLNPLFRKNEIEIFLEVPDDEFYLMLDYYRMKQVFVNLLKNAIEAKKNRGKAKIWITICEKKDRIQVYIKDNGMGMDTKTLKRVDEMFYTTKEKGTGLGVCLSKEIIELHEGTIKYHSSLGKGTTVTIDLPLLQNA